METNNLISIVIPTYNRSDFLDLSLSKHLPLLQKYNIGVYIFDNASDDNTEDVVKKWMGEYEFLNYVKYAESMGPEKTLGYALMYPKTKYVWLFGDTYQFNSLSLDFLMNLLNKEYNDLIVFNLYDKLKFESQIVSDYNLLLDKLGALMTCGAVTIANRNLIKLEYFNRYLGTYFPHTGLYFESLFYKKNIRVQWVQEYSITGLKASNLKKKNWSMTPKVFDIACEKWTHFILSLPPLYKLENKKKVIMDFGKISGAFTFKNIIFLRHNGLLNLKTFKKYKSFFVLTIDYPLYFIFFVSIIPRWLCGLFVFVKKITKL